MWVAPFWFWGIYRLNIHVPDIIERIFLSLWHLSPQLVAPSAVLGLSVLVVTLSVRKDPLGELGIRLDNLKSSARECFITFLIGGSLIVTVFLFHLKDFTFHSPINYFGLFLMYPFWGIAQQFLLQSIIFFRLLQIIKNKNLTILAGAIIFSLLHTANIPLMVVTFFAGLCCCMLFSRHRNIFTLGILHAVLAAMVYSLLVPGVIGNFKTGSFPMSWRTYTKFIAYLRYEGDAIVAKRAAMITIPIEVQNKSTALWDSHEKKHPVYISYHLLDAEGNMMTFDNVRTPFPHPIRPGESLTIDMSVAIPKDSGRYQLEVDIVKEWVVWFKDMGSLTVYIPLVVSNVESQPSRTLFK
jgi:Type II CAAX prenyl endopeptidase Rce1-like